MNLLLKIGVLLSFGVYQSHASIWIKNVKSYGPSAAIIGADCLSTLTKFYLKDPSLTRSRNLVISYSQNLTVPADNIQRLFLQWIHEAIVRGEVDE